LKKEEGETRRMKGRRRRSVSEFCFLEEEKKRREMFTLVVLAQNRT